MSFGLRYALDTNVLLRLSHKEHPLNPLVETATMQLISNEVELCYTPQNLGEFWNVSTRPLSANGFELPADLTEAHWTAIETKMTLLPETSSVYHVWRRRLIEHDVRGVQVHDAHLAATLEVHGIRHLLTFNVADFKRFDRISAVHPADV